MKTLLTLGLLCILLLAAQLLLGCDPLVVFLCAMSIVATLLLVWHFKFDLYGVLAGLLGIRYVGLALVAKTIFGQTMDANLKYPEEAFLFTLLILCTECLVIFLVRLLDTKRGLVELKTNAVDLAAARNFTIVLGAVAYAGMLVTRPIMTATAITGPFVVFSSFAKLFVLGLVAQTALHARRRLGEFISSPLLLGLGFLFLCTSFLNVRGALLAGILAVSLMASYHRAIKLRHILAGVGFIIFFGYFLSPLTLYLRYKKENLPLEQFASLAVSTAAQAAADPVFRQSIVDFNNSMTGLRKEEQVIGYDYYRLESNSNVLNRLSFVALVDWAYTGIKGREPLGSRVLEDSLERIVPSFMWTEKREKRYGVGDFIAWNTGQLPFGSGAYLNYSLMMEGLATFGLIGFIAYPFLFLFPFLFCLTRIASFSSPSVLSVYLLSIYQETFIEGTTEVILGELTRGLLILVAMILLLRLWMARHTPSD